MRKGREYKNQVCENNGNTLETMVSPPCVGVKYQDGMGGTLRFTHFRTMAASSFLILAMHDFAIHPDETTGQGLWGTFFGGS